MSIFNKIFIGVICSLILFVGLPQIDDAIDVDNLTELVEFEMEKEKLKAFTYQAYTFNQQDFINNTSHEHTWYVRAFSSPQNEIYLPPPKC